METCEFEVTANSSQTRNVFIPEGKAINFPRPEITGYNLTKSATDDLYHNFPISFDEQIVSEGILHEINGNSTAFVAPGYINGVKGMYTIGINNQNGVIFHRCFYSLDRFPSFRLSK